MSWAAVYEETSAEYGPARLVRSLEVSPRPGEVARARAFIRSSLGGSDVGEVDLIELMSSELVTNAVIHGRSQIALDLTVHERAGLATAVLVAVSDRSPTLPRQRPASENRENGRGLQIVSELSDGWGCQALAENSGKIVWFRREVRPRRTLRSAGRTTAETAGGVAHRDAQTASMGPAREDTEIVSGRDGRKSGRPGSPGG